MQRLITQPAHVTVSGRRASPHRHSAAAPRRVAARSRPVDQRTWRLAKLALGVLLAVAVLGLLGAIDNVVSASADGSHHPVTQRIETTSLR